MSAGRRIVVTAGAERQSVDAAALTSGNVSALPPRLDVHYKALPETAVSVSPQEAVDAAERTFNLTDTQLDTGIGVVRATVSVTGIPGHQADKAWVVTFNDPIRAPGNGKLYQKLSVAVDATDGQVLYALSVDPAG